MSTNHYKIVEVYRGIDIALVNHYDASKYYGIILNGMISAVCCYSVKAAKNVIDTWVRAGKTITIKNKIMAQTAKKHRDIVFKKYGGKCAYCGIDLVKGWHVDHINPKVFGGDNELENLNPSCKDCNNYKCHSSLETFRMYAKQMFNEKLHYLFKSKTKMQVAINMGVIKHTEWDGIFYFEQINS